MKGLLLNNYYSMQENIKLSAIIVFILFIGLVIAGDSIFVTALIMSITIYPLNIASSLQMDETSKWNKFEITIPVGRKTIVRAKYFSYLLLVMIGLFSSLLLAGFYIISGKEINTILFTYSICLGLSLSLLTGTFLYPFLLKFGAYKSEMYIILSFTLSGALIVLVWICMRMLIGELSFISPSVGILNVIISIICFPISYLISVHIHLEKEF